MEGMNLWQYNPMPQKVIIDKPESLDLVLKTPGVLWVEPVLSTNARNLLHLLTWVMEILLLNPIGVWFEW